MNSFEGQDAGNIRNADGNTYNLQGLRSLHDHELAEGVPDVRGWKVVDRNGDHIGRVDDLIVDPTAQVVRYIDVDLRDSVSPDDDKDYHLLIPVGTARLDDHDDCVHADNLTKDQLGGYPRATRGGINRTYENDVRSFYDNDTRSAGQYFANSRTDSVVGDRQLDSQVGSSLGTDMSAMRSASPDDASFHGSRDLGTGTHLNAGTSLDADTSLSAGTSLNAGGTSLDEFRSTDTYSNVSNLDTPADLDRVDDQALRSEASNLDIPVTGSTGSTGNLETGNLEVTDRYTISASDRTGGSDLDRSNDLRSSSFDGNNLNTTPAFTSATGLGNASDINDRSRFDNASSEDPTGLDSATGMRDTDILNAPTPLENRGIIDGGTNLASGAYADNFTDEDRNDRNSLDTRNDLNRTTLNDQRMDPSTLGTTGLNMGSTEVGTTGFHADRNAFTSGNDLSSSGRMGDVNTSASGNVNPDGTNSFTDRNNELSNFTENHLRQPGSVRDNQTEPGTFSDTDFYTDSRFDETRFFGNRLAGQRRGGISTFPEGEGRFTLRRRNI